MAEGDTMTRPPVPPFDEESARQKVKAAEDGWNTRDPEKVAQAYTGDSEWRNRDEFFKGRDEIVAFLTRKWERELDYRLMKELWCYAGNRISVRFEYESHDQDDQWWRSHPTPDLQRASASPPRWVGSRRSSWRWSS